MRRARWAVFAYHTIGVRALEALVACGEDVAVVVTHADDPGEGDWFGSSRGAAPGTLLEIVPSRGITVATGEGVLLIARVQSAGGVPEPADRWAAPRALRPSMGL